MNAIAPATTRIRFRTSYTKALEVILWCASKAGPGGVDFHTVLKVLFFADVAHLNEWGRPIVGDAYKALPYGPVPQVTYDIMKSDPLALGSLGMDSTEGHFEVRRFLVIGRRRPNSETFSESEIAALEAGWAKCAGLSFNARTALSHLHPAWERATSAGTQMMSYADFFENDEDGEKARDLAEISQDLRL